MRRWLLKSIIVICIVALAVWIAITSPSVSQLPDDGKRALTAQRMLALQEYSIDFKKRTGAYPTSFVTLQRALFPNITDDMLRDGWNRELLLVTNLSNRFIIESFGADGRQGGTGSNTDIVFDVGEK